MAHCVILYINIQILILAAFSKLTCYAKMVNIENIMPTKHLSMEVTLKSCAVILFCDIDLKS